MVAANFVRFLSGKPLINVQPKWTHGTALWHFLFNISIQVKVEPLMSTHWVQSLKRAMSLTVVSSNPYFTILFDRVSYLSRETLSNILLWSISICCNSQNLKCFSRAFVRMYTFMSGPTKVPKKSGI